MTPSYKNWTFALLLITIFSLGQTTLFAQKNVIQTAVPFLTITPESRGGAMGDVGVSSTPDVNSMHYNAAKYAFTENLMGIGFSYSPWMQKLVNDMSLSYLAGYYKLDKNQTIAMSMRFFSVGSIEHTTHYGEAIGTYKPNEFAIDAAYSRKFAENISGAVALRYIHSNLTNGQNVANEATKPGNTVAADVGVYQRLPITLGNYDATFSWGASFTNMGAKISYTDDKILKDFIPTMLRLGPSLSIDFDDYNTMSFLVDFTKLLVPTNPKKENNTIVDGMDPNVSVPVGMLHSFYDAPGGFKEELQEINLSGGVEYWYNKQFAVRGGYFYQSKTKGDSQYVTFGAGFRYNVFALDLSYLASITQNSPLNNTLRFSLTANLGNESR